MTCLRYPTAWLALAAMCTFAAPAARAESRGELLYATHCIACHTSQMHWREKRLVTDWRSLKLQVRRWQAVALLNWGEDDIVEVARHLNERHYRFVQTADPVTSMHRPADTPHGTALR